MIKKFLVLLFASFYSVILTAGGDEHFHLEKVADGIYVHAGQHVATDHEHADDIANIGFIEGDNCLAVIDTGGSINIGNELNNAIKAISDKPICYVINTHIHFDHVLGNYAFKDSGAEFVGHANLPDMIAASHDFFLEQYARYLTTDNKLNKEAIIAPTVTVEDTLELDLGNRIISLKAHPAAHSHSDLTIYDAKTRLMWLADLLFMDRLPIIDGKLKGWLSVMETFDSLDIEKVVPGHGPAISNWPEAKQAQERYLTTLLKETRAKIAEGAFMEEIVGQVESNEDDWLLYEEYHKGNVTRAFKELEWE